MKRILATLLVASMMVSMVACGKGDDKTSENKESTVTSESAVTSETTATESEAAGDETFGQALLVVFQEYMASKPDATAQEIADTVLASELIQFGPATMPVEPGFLMGFKEEVDGFKEAVQFSPMIGTIPFMGFIFELADDADTDAFVEQLEGKANLAWNICTEAEEMVIDVIGNKVFFLMCPKSANLE